MSEVKEKYAVSYWVNKKESIAIIRISDFRVQGWKPFGRDIMEDFEHSHFQKTYPSKERLDHYLTSFELSNVDEFLEYQFAHHQLDDHFREKANEFKNERMRSKQTNLERRL